jgi:hypothetical protein
MATDLVFVAIASAVVIAASLVLLTRTDAEPTRVGGLAMDGKTCADWRIVRVTRWVNCRAGLLNHAGLAPFSGLWLAGVRRVHTRGMLFAIDVIFLGRDGTILAINRSVPPGQARVVGPRGAAAALEVAAGSVDQLGLAVDQRLQHVPLPL